MVYINNGLKSHRKSRYLWPYFGPIIKSHLIPNPNSIKIDSFTMGSRWEKSFATPLFTTGHSFTTPLFYDRITHLRREFPSQITSFLVVITIVRGNSLTLMDDINIILQDFSIVSLNIFIEKETKQQTMLRQKTILIRLIKIYIDPFWIVNFLLFSFFSFTR